MPGEGVIDVKLAQKCEAWVNFVTSFLFDDLFSGFCLILQLFLSSLSFPTSPLHLSSQKCELKR